MCVKREMKEGFQVSDLTPHLGGVTPLPGIAMGTSTVGAMMGHGRSQSMGVPRDRFVSTMEMGNIGSKGPQSMSAASGGKGAGEYERVPTQDRKE